MSRKRRRDANWVCRKPAGRRQRRSSPLPVPSFVVFDESRVCHEIESGRLSGSMTSDPKRGRARIVHVPSVSSSTEDNAVLHRERSLRGMQSYSTVLQAAREDCDVRSSFRCCMVMPSACTSSCAAARGRIASSSSATCSITASSNSVNISR